MQSSLGIKLVAGQKIPVVLDRLRIEAIVIDPNGLGQNQPSLGLEFRTLMKYYLLPFHIHFNWTKGVDKEWIELLSGNVAKVLKINELDGNETLAVEACEWILLSDEYKEELKNGGIATEESQQRDGRIDIVFRFYKDAYGRSGGYTDDDLYSVSDWIFSRAISLSQNLQWKKLLVGEES